MLTLFMVMNQIVFIIPMFILKIRMNRSGLRRNLQNRLFERWMILKF